MYRIELTWLLIFSFSMLGLAASAQQRDSIQEQLVLHHGSYFECIGGPCNGYKISYHPNGLPHIVGHFREGKPYDSLKRYSVYGTLESITYYGENEYKFITYHDNGEIESLWENKDKKATLRRFYPNRAVKSVTHYGDRFSRTEYYPNGSVRESVRNKDKKVYHSNGQLQASYTRKEVGKLARIVSRDHFRFYEYFYKQYDEAGHLFKEATFFGNWHMPEPYPYSLTSVKEKDYYEVKYYNEQGEVYQKDHYTYEKVGDKFKKVVNTYTRQGGELVKVSTEVLED